MVSSPELGIKTRYLVLEPIQKRPLLQELYEIAERPQWVYLFADTDWHAYVTESPILLEALEGSAEYRWAVNELKQQSVSGLILESSKGLGEVANWLRARLTVRFDGQRQGLLRFYDPLIWHQLAPQINPAAEVIEQAIYWYGAPGHERWMTTQNPEPIAMLPAPTLDEQQRLALTATNV